MCVCICQRALCMRALVSVQRVCQRALCICQCALCAAMCSVQCASSLCAMCNVHGMQCALHCAYVRSDSMLTDELLTSDLSLLNRMYLSAGI